MEDMNYSEKTPPVLAPGKGELVLALAVAVISILLCNAVFIGGFNLGFALTAMALTGCSWGYLRKQGLRFDWYSRSLLILSLIIAAGFGYSDDAFVKFVLFFFLTAAVNLGLCLGTGKNRRSPNGAASLLDAPRALFRFGFGSMEPALRGLVQSIRGSGAAGQKTWAVVLGLGISIPILLVMVPLLMDADAAFEGLLRLLPEVDLMEYFYSALFGLLLGWLLYSRGLGLAHRTLEDKPARELARLNNLTVGTVLSAVCALYAVYLISQLAYFFGGFSGILPAEYTLAEYARRGFFEMAWLCAINLMLICSSAALVKNRSGFVKVACLFLALVTLFLVATASAKMFLYIGSFGLTRLRVLTEVIMLMLALTTVVVSIWLFQPKLPYMKVLVLSALMVGSAVLWGDVDRVVARYNVSAYQSGALETVDVDYLGSLSASALPQIARLVEDPDPAVANQAAEILCWRHVDAQDLRSWNWARAQAAQVLESQ